MTAIHRFAIGVAALISLSGCRELEPTTGHLQGRVRSLGLQTPIPAAQVTVQWPRGLAGGVSTHRTNSEGQYVVERTVRQREVSCAGLAISVEAAGYATAYARYTEADCGGDALTFDFTLYPIPR